MLAPRASEVDEASREVAAAKIPAKLVLHVARKRPVVRLARVPKELRSVLLHEPIDHRPVRLSNGSTFPLWLKFALRASCSLPIRSVLTSGRALRFLFAHQPDVQMKQNMAVIMTSEEAQAS